MLPKVTTFNRNGNGNDGNGHQVAQPMTPAERDHLRWLLREIRPHDDFLVEYRGYRFSADADLAAAVLRWGGRIVQSTYRPRNNH